MPLTNAPKILRGAFIEYGLSIPPLFVVFQYNPVELTRSRSLTFNAPNETVVCPPRGEDGEASVQCNEIQRQQSLREFHQNPLPEGEPDKDQLLYIQEHQKVTINEETISFDIRLDATDKMSDGDPIAATFGVLPQLATLELMVHPKDESLLAAALGSLLGSSGGFSFTKKENPPMILFIWGHKRVLPVNITSMNIKETEFSTLLDPIRATVSVSLTVIEGKNLAYQYSKVVKEASAVLNLANITDLANVVIPG